MYGKILGDSVDSVLGCGLVLKNALGVVGVIIIIGICITPIIRLSILTIMYNLSSAIIEPLADEKIVKLLELQHMYLELKLKLNYQVMHFQKEEEIINNYYIKQQVT